VIVIAAERLDGSSSPGQTGPTVDSLTAVFGERLRPMHRDAAHDGSGHGLELAVDGGATAIGVALALTRVGGWSVGVGIGAAIGDGSAHGRRSRTGGAFGAARSAEHRARKKTTRFAVAAEPRTSLAADTEAFVDLLLVLRARRSGQGWEIRDLVDEGLTQADAAARIGITPQSASKRARAADIKAEDAAIPSLGRLLDALDNRVARTTVDRH
jgi:hypothetical protein